LFEALVESFALIFELHSGTSEAVVVAIMMLGVLPFAEPAKLEPAFLACHVVATI
jgi:hypothetical protein